MPILDHWELSIDVNDVLRGQGADPAVLFARRPRLFETAALALKEGLPLIHPQVLYERFFVEDILHERVRFIGGGELRGKALVQHLASVQEVLLVICTIGYDLEKYTDKVMELEIVHGLALYGVGSAAVEALSNAACLHFERDVVERGWQTTIPISPGMIGWSVEEGQPQIFSLLNGDQIGVSLNEAAIMQPRKSLSLILGQGPELNQRGTTCDYCAMQETCKYQSSYVRTS
jgi:hypothetical protein